jgi:hypothetical protein
MTRKQFESLKTVVKRSIEISEKNMKGTTASVVTPLCAVDDPEMKRMLWFQYFWGERDAMQRILSVIEDIENEQ